MTKPRTVECNACSTGVAWGVNFPFCQLCTTRAIDRGMPRCAHGYDLPQHCSQCVGLTLNAIASGRSPTPQPEPACIRCGAAGELVRDQRPYGHRNGAPLGPWLCWPCYDETDNEPCIQRIDGVDVLAVSYSSGWVRLSSIYATVTVVTDDPGREPQVIGQAFGLQKYFTTFDEAIAFALHYVVTAGINPPPDSDAY